MVGKCFANHHMDLNQYGLWSYIRTLQSNQDYVYFSFRGVANNFSISKDTVRRTYKKLVNDGWLIILAKNKIRALSHEEWAKINQNKCLGYETVDIKKEHQECDSTVSKMTQSVSKMTPSVAPLRLDKKIELNKKENIYIYKNLQEPKLADTEDNTVALSDKIRSIVWEKTGKDIRIPDYMVKRFRKSSPEGEANQLNHFREFLDNVPYSGNPVSAFIAEVEGSEVSKMTPGVYVKGELDTKVRDLGIRIYTDFQQSFYGQGLVNAYNMLQQYTEDEVMMAFRYHYNKLDERSKPYAARIFFYENIGERVIPSVLAGKKRQEEMLKKVDSLPAKPWPEPEQEEDISPEEGLFS